MRRVADALLDPQLSPMMIGNTDDVSDRSDDMSKLKKVADGSGTAATTSTSTPATSATSVSTSPALTARQQAAILYALAGDQGDTESLLQLGWMLYYGDKGMYFICV